MKVILAYGLADALVVLLVLWLRRRPLFRRVNMRSWYWWAGAMTAIYLIGYTTAARDAVSAIGSVLQAVAMGLMMLMSFCFATYVGAWGVRQRLRWVKSHAKNETERRFMLQSWEHLPGAREFREAVESLDEDE